MKEGTRVERLGVPGMTGTIACLRDEETALVEWDNPLPFVAGDRRKPITLITLDLLKVVNAQAPWGKVGP